jgi:hypothetical protein
MRWHRWAFSPFAATVSHPRLRHSILSGSMRVDCIIQVEAVQEAAGDWRGAYDYQGLAYGTQYDAAYGSWPPASVEQLICDPTILAVSLQLQFRMPATTKSPALWSIYHPDVQLPVHLLWCAPTTFTHCLALFVGRSKPLWRSQILQRGVRALFASRRAAGLASRF